MRISDWSSDVCSSDLLPARAVAVFPVAALGLGEAVTIRERLGIAPEKPQAVEEIAHLGSPLAIVRFVTCFPWSSCGGLGREPRYSARRTTDWPAQRGWFGMGGLCPGPGNPGPGAL